MHDIAHPGIERLGEDALLLRVGEGVDVAVNARVHRLVVRLTAARIHGIRETAPAYASVLLRLELAVCLDPTAFAACVAQVRAILDDLRQADDSDHATADMPQAEVIIPVAYGGVHGPDLEALAAHAGLEVDAVVACHSGARYRVAMLGFAPGFSYLLGLPEALQMPRRSDPRLRVPPGSVAIGGVQTGIYPAQLPGGWNLIGRTPLRLFDPARNPPCLLAAGQAVRFQAIDGDEFARLEALSP